MDVLKNGRRPRGVIALQCFKSHGKAVFIACLILLPLAAMLLVECTARGGWQPGYEWVLGITDDIRTPLYNYAIYIGIFLLIHSLTNRLHITGEVYAALACIFSIVNFNKYNTRLMYFSPNDISTQLKSGDMMKLVGKFVPGWQLAAAICAMLAVTLLLYILGAHFRLPTRGRVVAGVLSAAIVAVGINTFALARPGSGFDYAFWLYEYTYLNTNNNFTKNGMLASFMGHIGYESYKQDAPEGYSAEVATDAELRFLNAGEPDSNAMLLSTGMAEQPDKVIVILAESFTDVAQSNATLSMDPIPDIREDLVGKAVSPTFGGGTANVEFEMLTGFSMYAMGDATVPYDGIARNTPSYVWQMKELGYRTSAMHTYYGNYYRRSDVYPLLGFDEFISIEDMENVKRKGSFFGDEDFAREIIEHTSNDEKQFVFAITMQSHGPHNDGRLGQGVPELTAHSDLLTEAESAELLAYTKGTYDTNSMYAMLKEHYAQSGQNVLIVLFGDHYPGLDSSILDKLEFFDAGDVAASRMMPLCMWSNYCEMPMLDQPYSMNYLIPIAAEGSGMRMTPFMESMAAMKEWLPVLTTLPIDGYANGVGAYESMLDDYTLLIYDAVYGGQFAGRDI